MNDKDHIEFLCELYEAQAAQGRYFVHELTSEVNSRKKCVGKTMVMPGTRTAMEDLCVFWLAACDEGGPVFVNTSVRTITNARQVNANERIGMPGSTPKDTIGRKEQAGTWVRQAARAMEEQLRQDK